MRSIFAFILIAASLLVLAPTTSICEEIGRPLPQTIRIHGKVLSWTAERVLLVSNGKKIFVPRVWIKETLLKEGASVKVHAPSRDLHLVQVY